MATMDLLDKFVEHLNNQKRKPSFFTAKNYKADVGQFIKWFEKEFNSPFEPSKVNMEVLGKYKDDRQLSPTSLERHLSSLRKFYKFLKETGRVDFDLFEKNENKAIQDPWKLRNFTNYLYEYKKSQLTIKNYINDIKNFFDWYKERSKKENPQISDEELLKTIDLPILGIYEEEMASWQLSPKTIKRKLSSLRNYLKWAKEKGFTMQPESPVSQIELAQEEITEPKVINEPETTTEANNPSKPQPEPLIARETVAKNVVIPNIPIPIDSTPPAHRVKKVEPTQTQENTVKQSIFSSKQFWLYFIYVILLLAISPLLAFATYKFFISRPSSTTQEAQYSKINTNTNLTNQNNAKDNAISQLTQKDTIIKVSLENGPIKKGDSLTVSDIPDVGVKATGSQRSIGKALDDVNASDDSKIVGYYNSNQKEYRDKDELPNIPLKPDLVKVYEIKAAIDTPVAKKTSQPATNNSTSEKNIFTKIESFFETVSSNIIKTFSNPKDKNVSISSEISQNY